jgi:hypothetical protein
MTMKNKNLNLVTSAVLAASAMIPGILARAADLPQTKAHQQLSVTQGFSEPTLSVLQRTSAADPGTVSFAVLEKLGPAGAYQATKVGTKLRITGAKWSLEVAGDGSAAEYQDLAVEAQAHSLGKPLSAEMSAAELEQRGRAFITSHLASEIVLGSDEELVALRADYRTEGGQDVATGEISQAVVANRIVFSRTIHGVPVVGNGSKVTLTFANDGSLESFRYDWPTYQVASTQTVVDASEILSRVQKVVSARNGVSAPTSRVVVPSNKPSAYPVELTSNTQLQALDCGYYDAGSRAPQTQSVQPGCTYLAVSKDSNGMRAGYAGAIPAGTQFASDAAWLETQILGAQ